MISELLDIFSKYGIDLVLAFILTLELTFLSFSIGFVGGIIIAVLRSSIAKPFRSLLTLFIEIVRGTPMIVQLFFVYYTLPVLGIKLDSFTASLIALGLNSAAYQSEYLRTAINSIPREQWEAAYSLGLSSFSTVINVVIPQALRIAIPSLTNELIYLLKFSSIAYFVALPELIYTAKWIASKTFAYMQIYIVIALFYIAVSMILSEIVTRIEKKVSIPGLTIKVS
ncbi:MAG: amino acid ABC transporter permease [Ignisphaera sp.]